MEQNNEPKIVSQEEVLTHLQDQINQSLYDLENSLLPQLGHSQAKRLLMAAASYPMKVEDFSKDSEAMIKAYSAIKTVTDALVALGTEVALQGIIESQMGKPEESPVGPPDSYFNEQQFLTEEEKPKKRKTKKAE